MGREIAETKANACGGAERQLRTPSKEGACITNARWLHVVNDAINVDIVNIGAKFELVPLIGSKLRAQSFGLPPTIRTRWPS
jgi:hypothetical protein